MNSNIENLVIGKVYKCKFIRTKSEYSLLWTIEDSNINRIRIGSSIFIFLGYQTKSNPLYVTLKGLIDGKILYAKECCVSSFYFEELS